MSAEDLLSAAQEVVDGVMDEASGKVTEKAEDVEAAADRYRESLRADAEGEEEEKKELTVLEEPGDESEPEQVINVPKSAVTTVGDGTGPNASVETDAPELEAPVVMKEEEIFIGGSALPVREGTELLEGERQEAEVPPPESGWKNRTVEEDEVEPEPTKIAIISLFHNRKTEVEFESFDGKPWTWKHISMVRASLRRGFAKYNADRKKELRNGR